MKGLTATSMSTGVATLPVRAVSARLRGTCGSTVELAVVDSASAHRVGQQPRILAVPRLQSPETPPPCLAQGRECHEERKRQRSVDEPDNTLTQPHMAKFMRLHRPDQDGAKTVRRNDSTPHGCGLAESIIISTFDVAKNRQQEKAIDVDKFDVMLFEAHRLKSLQQRFRGTPLCEARPCASRSKLESEVTLCAAVDTVCPGAMPVGSGKDYDEIAGCSADKAILPIVLWSSCP